MPSSGQVRKNRDYCFTINNPTGDDRVRITADYDTIDYIIYGEETGTMGTPHLQGFVQFKHPVSLQRAKRVIGETAHLESRRGTVIQAIEYCKKDGQFFEKGNPQRLSASETQRDKWKSIIQLAETGRLTKIKDEYPSYYLRYLNTLKSLNKGNNIILSELQNEWWWGPTGTGKSYTLWKKYPQHYQKELNKWWCGYIDEEVVAIEEWCPKNECTASQLKIWADRYPFTAQIKGGSLQKIRPLKIIVLSNYSIDQCFSNPEDREPIKRRFKEIHYPFKITALPHYPTLNLGGQGLDTSRVGSAMAQTLPSPTTTINTSELNLDLEFINTL